MSRFLEHALKAVSKLAPQDDAEKTAFEQLNDLIEYAANASAGYPFQDEEFAPEKVRHMAENIRLALWSEQ